MKLNFLRSATSVFALVAAVSLTPTVAFAQSGAVAQSGADVDDGEDIVVTAQRREEKSVDVPISITTISAAQLETANVNSLSDTAKLTPGLRFDSQGAAMQPTIRGVGTAITTSGGGPNVGIYVDGFFQPNTYSADLQLMKVSSIQVLKGPQGTLFGRNTTGGAILVTSADPSTTTSGEFKASYGRFNALTLQGYATTGLSENIALDIEGLYRSGDGYFETLAGDDKVGKYESWSIRAGLKVEVSDSVSLLLRYLHTENDDPTPQLTNIYVDSHGTAGFLSQVSAAGRAAYGVQSSQGRGLSYFYAPAGTVATQPGKIAKDAKTKLTQRIDAVQATIKADLGFANFTSYTHYRDEATPYYGDLDATALPFFGLFVDIQDKTFSQEFVLNSKPGSQLQWTAGLNYFNYKDCYCAVDASFGGAPYIRFGGSSTTTKSYAAFLDMTYELNDKLFLTAGARYSQDNVEDSYFVTNPFTSSYLGPLGQSVAFAGAPGTRIPVDTLKNNSITPRFVIRYKPSEDSTVYASYTRGYKAGILNVGGLSQQPIKPEKIGAWELGYKYDNRTLSLDFAGFYYDYKNLQVSSFQSGAAQIRNAASSEIYGLEGQFRYRAGGGFTVYGGSAWTHARYKSFKNAPYYSWCDPAAAAGTAAWCVPIAFGGFGPGGIVQLSTDASGFKMQRAPEFTGNLGASYDADLGGGKLTLSGNVYYTSSFFFDPEQQFKQSGYSLVSLRAQWTDPSDRFTVAVFGDNVGNKRYLNQVLFTTLGTGSVWGAPATYGASVGVKF